MEFRLAKNCKAKRKNDPIARRPPVSRSLGCHGHGAVLPRPADDPVSAASGALKRIGTDTGKMTRKTRQQFCRFVDLFCEEYIPKLDPTIDLSVESWLQATTYPEGRRSDLLRTFEEGSSNMDGPFSFSARSKRKIYDVNNFIKDEFYETYKHPRMINSRSDLYKVVVGPIFAQISKLVFGLKYSGKDYGPLIKHVPVADRSVVLSDLLTDYAESYQITDYSSFEAHFTSEMMESCEFRLYNHCTKNLSCHKPFMKLLRDSMAKVNHIKNKWFKIMLQATRMSGEMNTSLGNGFSNMMFTLFLANRAHIKNGYSGSLKSWIDNWQLYVRGAFEGDDGLCVFHPLCKPVTSDFTEMGLIIKLVDVNEIGLASFCGNLFDPVDLIQVTNPLKVLCGLGWSNKKYVSSKPETRAAILRCKANSYLNQYPGCPIVNALACYILRCTGEDVGRELRYLDNSSHWLKGKYSQAYKNLPNLGRQPTPGRTRLLVEKLYDVTVDQQLKMEEYLDSLTEIQPLDLSIVWENIPAVWKHNWDTHVIHKYDEGPIITLNEKERAMDHIRKMSGRNKTVHVLGELI